MFLIKGNRVIEIAAEDLFFVRGARLYPSRESALRVLAWTDAPAATAYRVRERFAEARKEGRI